MDLTDHQTLFCGDLASAFIDAGFEIIKEPYHDVQLGRYHATYTRRYFLQRSTLLSQGTIDSYVDVVGIPIGKRGLIIYARKMGPDRIMNHLGEALKLRVYFNHCNEPEAAFGGGQPNYDNTAHQRYDTDIEEKFESKQDVGFKINRVSKLTLRMKQLNEFVGQIIQLISPGLIELPIELKLEILKKMSIDSIVKMAQVNYDFFDLIYQHGDPLWRHLCRRDFNSHVINRRLHKTWLDLYKSLHKQYIYDLIKNSRALPPVPILPALPPVPNRLPIDWFPAIGPFVIAMDFPIHRAPPPPPSRHVSLENLDRVLIE